MTKEIRCGLCRELVPKGEALFHFLHHRQQGVDRKQEKLVEVVNEKPSRLSHEHSVEAAEEMSD